MFFCIIKLVYTYTVKQINCEPREFTDQIKITDKNKKNTKFNTIFQDFN